MSIRKLMLAAALSLASIAAFAADVAGTWTMNVEMPQGQGTRTFTLEQKGEALTGTTTGQMGDSKVTGTIKGNDLTLSYSLDMQGQALTVTYTGKVEGNTASGKIDFGGMGEGTFKGTKK
jgi:hypothetical protein